MSTAIEIRSLTHTYLKGTKNRVAAVEDVSLTVERGEILGLIGHTGSGKSTLISHFNGLLKPDSGTVTVDGEDIWSSKEALRRSRFKVGLCFQYPEYQLFEETVFKDIAFGPKNMKLPEEEIKKRVLYAADMAGVKRSDLDKSPFDLSGGEKRRAAIAGVMAMEPQVLVFDEPAAGLDPAGRRELYSMIKNYREATGCAVIMVSHSMEDIAAIADRICVMNAGKIAMTGTVKQVFFAGDLLREMGLDVPEVTRVLLMLRDAGIDVPADIYTVEEALPVLKRLLEGRGTKR